MIKYKQPCFKTALPEIEAADLVLLVAGGSPRDFLELLHQLEGADLGLPSLASASRFLCLLPPCYERTGKYMRVM